MFDDNSPQGAAPKNLPISEPDDMFSDTEKGGSTMSAPPGVSPEGGNSALGAGKLKPKTTETVVPTLGKASAGLSASMPDTKPTIAKAPSLSERISAMPKEEYKTKEPVLGKVFIVIIVVAAAIGLGYGAWLFYVDYTEDTIPPVRQNEIQSTGESAQESADAISETVDEAAEEETATSTGTEEETTEDEDTMVIPQPIDDDGDSLSNAREEELGTDPMLADTDKDGLRDGDEVIIWATNPLNADSDGDGYLDGEEIENGYNPMGPGKLFTDEAGVETNI